MYRINKSNFEAMLMKLSEKINNFSAKNVDVHKKIPGVMVLSLSRSKECKKNF